jgi:tetratricopeptide (TPR) repeat protein
MHKRLPVLIVFFLLLFAFDQIAPAADSAPPTGTGSPSTIQNQPIVVPSFESVEMERLRLAEETSKGERDEVDFQKQVSMLQKKLAEASATTVLPESMPSDYRAFLSANSGDIERSNAYYAELKSILNELVPESPYHTRSAKDSSNPQRASEKLLKLSSYTEDDDICRSIRGHISALSGGRVDDNRRQSELSRELTTLQAERKRHEWNLKMAHNVSPLTGETRSEDERNFIRQQIEDVKKEIARCEDEKNSLSHRVTSEVRKLQFQQFIVELAIQQRYIHALIACGFYRNSFKGADLALRQEAYPSGRSGGGGSENSPGKPPTSGGAPTEVPVISTVTGMEAFLLNRVRDAVKDRESIDNMLQENQIAAAESLVRKMVLTAKYQPELQTIPYDSRQKILQGGHSMRRLAEAVNSRDYAEINRLVKELESKGSDTGVADLKAFAAEHPRKAMHWARQAELAMKARDLKSMHSLMEIAVRRAPLDSDVAKKIESIQENATNNQGLYEELKRIVSAGDHRAAFDRMNEFAPLAQEAKTDPKLKSDYESLLELEKDLRAAIEKSDSLERRGNHPEAWIVLETLPDSLAKDPRALERKARLAGQCPKFIGSHTKAVANEQANRPAKALAWYLNALAESPGNEEIVGKIQTLGNSILKN